jgi:hypothetical protein
VPLSPSPHPSPARGEGALVLTSAPPVPDLARSDVRKADTAACDKRGELPPPSRGRGGERGSLGMPRIPSDLIPGYHRIPNTSPLSPSDLIAVGVGRHPSVGWSMLTTAPASPMDRRVKPEDDDGRGNRRDALPLPPRRRPTFVGGWERDRVRRTCGAALTFAAVIYRHGVPSNTFPLSPSGLTRGSISMTAPTSAMDPRVKPEDDNDADANSERGALPPPSRGRGGVRGPRDTALQIIAPPPSTPLPSRSRSHHDRQY